MLSGVVCDRLVAGQHELLNDSMGQIAVAPQYLQRQPLLIKDDLGLREIKVQGPALQTHVCQGSTQLRHILQHGDHLMVLLPDASVALL